MNDDKSWYLQYVEDENLIEGSPEGLIKLRTAIDEAIQSGYVGLDVNSGCNILGVSVSDPEMLRQPDGGRNRTFFGIVLVSLTFIWFVVLPFVAIGLLVYILLFSGNSERVDHRSLYIQDLLKEQYQHKRD